MVQSEATRPTRRRLSQATTNLTQLLDYFAKGGYQLAGPIELQGPGQKITVVREGAKHKAVQE